MQYFSEVDGELTDEERAQIEETRARVAAMRKALDAGGTPDPLPQPVLGMPFAYLRDMQVHDPLTIAAGLELPLLVLQGERDVNVTVDDFALWKERLAGKPGRCFRVYPGLDHFFVAGEGPVTPASAMAAGAVAGAVIEDVARFVLDGACPAGEAAGG